MQRLELVGVVFVEVLEIIVFVGEGLVLFDLTKEITIKDVKIISEIKNNRGIFFIFYKYLI
jgi:hypothetical protein